MAKNKIDLAKKYDYYESSVQNPENEVDFMLRWGRKISGKKPVILREDFCGTGAISCDWVKRSPHNKAYGIDLDDEPIALGKERHFSKLDPKQKRQMHYLQEDVLKTKKFKSDVICAFNFSYNIFKERKVLLNYFKKVRAGLNQNGVFFLDLFGGPDSQRLVTDVKKIKGLTYYWECKKFNPITAHCLFAIHFKDKKSKYKNVFTYDWRLWTLPELTDLLEEAGFSKVIPFWEGEDDDGGGDGDFFPAGEEENCEAWVSYIAAKA